MASFKDAIAANRKVKESAPIPSEVEPKQEPPTVQPEKKR